MDLIALAIVHHGFITAWCRTGGCGLFHFRHIQTAGCFPGDFRDKGLGHGIHRNDQGHAIFAVFKTVHDLSEMFPAAIFIATDTGRTLIDRRR
ncbi:hypothetical protein D3C80_1978340 [compost metagenome]